MFSVTDATIIVIPRYVSLLPLSPEMALVMRTNVVHTATLDYLPLGRESPKEARLMTAKAQTWR